MPKCHERKCLNPIEDGAFSGLFRDGWGGAEGGKKAPPLHISHNDETWRSYTLPKRFKKYINHVTRTLNSAEISIFSPEISNFFCIKKYRYRLHFNTEFLILLTVFESLTVVLIKVVAILMMPTKLATLGLLEIKVFWNKVYDVIISAHDVINKILSRESNYIGDVVMWPEFVDSNISMREFVITLIL